jgi:hypothetical protein
VTGNRKVTYLDRGWQYLWESRSAVVDFLDGSLNLATVYLSKIDSWESLSRKAAGPVWGTGYRIAISISVGKNLGNNLSL